MLQFTPSDAIEAVRKNLDEQGWNPSAMFGESADNSELNDIIKKTIPEAIDAVHLAAPVDMLESCETSFVEDGVTDGVLDFHPEKPVLRLVSVKAADSEIVLASSFAETAPVARLQSNRYLRGTRKDPVLVKRNGTRNRFKYYSVGSRTVNRPKRIADYLYEYSVDNLDYNYAKDYFEHRGPDVNIGSCSCVQNGRYFGSNYDWLYDEGASVLVRTKAKNGRHAVTGMAGGLSGFTKELVESGVDSELYKILPFYLIDGINDAGVFAKIQVINNIWNADATVPTQTEDDRICTLMLVRYILDNFSTAYEAVNYIREHVSLFSPTALHDMGYEVHFMVGDRDNTNGPYIIELVDDTVKINSDYSQLTNFYMDGVNTGNPDGNEVYTQADITDSIHPTSDWPDGNSLSEYSTGLERWNIITQAFHGGLYTKAEMRALMNSLLFTNAYKDTTNPFWYSEFASPGTYNVDSPITDSSVILTVNKAKDEFAKRDRRNPTTWHTVHSCIYDLVSGNIYIVSQEDTAHEHFLTFGGEVPGSHLERVDYITYASPAEEYEISAALLKPMYDELTALVLAIYGENDKAQYFFQKATIQ